MYSISTRLDLRSCFFLSLHAQEGLTHARRSPGICSVDGPAPQAGVSTMRRSLSRPLSSAAVLLPRSVSGDGVCATHLPGELAGRRDLPARHGQQAVPRRLSWQDFAQHLGRRQRAARLENLPRLRPGVDCPYAATVRQRAFGDGACANGVRPRLDHHRALLVLVSLGSFPTSEGRHQVAHPAGPAGQYSLFCAAFHGKNGRQPDSRSVDSRARIVLRHGSRLQRLRATPPLDASRRVFCRPLSKQYHLRPRRLAPWIAPRACAAIKRFVFGIVARPSIILCPCAASHFTISNIGGDSS